MLRMIKTDFLLMLSVFPLSHIFLKKMGIEIFLTADPRTFSLSKVGLMEKIL